MALEAVVLQQDLFGYSNGKEFYGNLVGGGGNWGCDFGQQEREKSEEDKVQPFLLDEIPQTSDSSQYRGWNSPSMADRFHSNALSSPAEAPPSRMPHARPKRRRVKCRKNKEDIENQRMTHIAVERNRRKQMNEYLSVLKSLMPDSYAQRGDQASIVGGAINFVKELEQRLQFLGTLGQTPKEEPRALPFSEFFTFPQFSTAEDGSAGGGGGGGGVADVEVTMVESHVSIKIRTRRRRRQLLRMAAGLQTLKLTILHLNVTTADQIVLYSLSVKVEDECRLSSVDEIATAVHQLLGRIQEEAISNI